MKKRNLALLCIAMAGMVLSGCAAGNASGTTATAAPIVTNSPMPTATAQQTMTPMTTMQTSEQDSGMKTDSSSGPSSVSSMTPAQAGRLADQIEEAVERISEIDDAEVVVSDERVLVAVEFDDQYSTGLDERMKQMITEAVQKVDDKLTDVEITDDSTLYGQVKGLGERLAKATGLDELADDFGDLWNRMTGM
ncbi:MAG: YhcN/YlaJ family sporulation lipoprotein [Clostridia bacterium]|nr:YhcN/YlaJ family sporulation lipoprotein [Clostridia bacterium]